jgi:Chromo (CHRromatin Organisation MOdifier) domain
MDFITGLPPSKHQGNVYDSILVVVDRLSKMAEYIPARRDMTAVQLAEIFFERIALRYGMPKGIVTDRGSLFTSEWWGEVCQIAGAARRLSTSFHPQTDGQTERQNQTLEQYLRVYVGEKQDDWAKWLPYAQYAYNNSTHAVTGETPFYLVHFFRPEIGWSPAGEEKPTRVPAAREFADMVAALRATLAETLREANETQARYYNKKHKPKTYSIGDWVMLSAKNLKQNRPSKKLSNRWLGPFQIEATIGKQAYRVILPKNMSRVHPTFHVSLLEPFKRRDGESPATHQTAPEILGSGDVWDIEEILARRKQKNKYFYKVRWVGWSPEYDSWIREDHLYADGAKQEYDQRFPRPSKRLRKRRKG